MNKAKRQARAREKAKENRLKRAAEKNLKAKRRKAKNKVGVK